MALHDLLGPDRDPTALRQRGRAIGRRLLPRICEVDEWVLWLPVLAMEELECPAVCAGPCVLHKPMLCGAENIAIDLATQLAFRLIATIYKHPEQGTQHHPPRNQQPTHSVAAGSTVFSRMSTPSMSNAKAMGPGR